MHGTESMAIVLQHSPEFVNTGCVSRQGDMGVPRVLGSWIGSLSCRYRCLYLSTDTSGASWCLCSIPIVIYLYPYLQRRQQQPAAGALPHLLSKLAARDCRQAVPLGGGVHLAPLPFCLQFSRPPFFPFHNHHRHQPTTTWVGHGLSARDLAGCTIVARPELKQDQDGCPR